MTEIELETNEEHTDETHQNTQNGSNTSTFSQIETDQNGQNESNTVSQSLNKQMSTIGVVEYKENDEHAVVFQNLSYSITKFTRYPPFRKKVEIIRDASGYIPSNCLCGIIGQSGAGKTTLLGLLAGIPKSGTKTGHVAVSSKKIALVSQIPHISQTEKVYEILRFSSSVTYNPDATKTSNKSRFAIISDRISKVLSTLNLSGVRDRQIRYLSGGELKRVSIAMQLMTSPDILVLDEPTSGLDTPNALSIIQTLRRIVKTHNCTVIMSIHQPHKRICDCMEWILSLKNGLLLYMGSLPDAFKCRDIFLNEIVSKLKLPINAQNNNNNYKLPIEGRHISVEIESRSTDYNEKDNETKIDNTVKPLIVDEYFDIKLIRNLNNVYNVNIIDDEDNVNNNLLRLLITDIISDGHNIGNAADYLLETEYLSTSYKLHENWLTYRDNKYKSFNNKIIDSLSNNLNLEKKICACDINNIFGCDVGDYFESFIQCDTYMHAFWAFIGLSMRTLRYYYRKWWIFVFNVIISVAAAFVLGSIYGKMSEEQDDIQNRFGAFGFICIFIGIQAIAASGTFHEIRDVFIDDRNGKLYGATPFLFARTIPDLCLLRIVPSVLFGMILFEMLGFQKHTETDFMLVIIVLSCVSSLCVFTISSLMPDAYIAGFVAIFLNMLFMLYGGVFIQDESKIPYWIQWPKELSFYNFAFEILMVNEFQKLSFKIDSTTVSIGGADISFDSSKTDVRISGEFFLGFFGMDIDDVEYDWMMLIVWCVVYFIVAWLALELLYRSRR